MFEKVGRRQLPAFAQQRIQRLRRTERDGFYFEVVPTASGANGFGEVEKLLGNAAFISSPRLNSTAGGNQRGLMLGMCGQPLEKSGNFGVVCEPIEAQFGQIRLKQTLRELSLHLLHPRCSNHGAHLTDA